MNEQDKEDAERWRALMSCERIRVIGYAREGGGGRLENTGPIKHIGIEFWDTFPEDTGESSERLVEFVDGMRQKAKAESAKNCHWCDEPKENPYGLCVECHRFPPTQDFSIKKELETKKVEREKLTEELREAISPISDKQSKLAGEVSKIQFKFLDTNGLDPTRYRISSWSCEHSPVGKCIEDSECSEFCCVYCGEPNERK